MRRFLPRVFKCGPRRWQCLSVCFACALLAACSATGELVVPPPEFPLRSDALFGPRPDIPTVAEIHTLTPEQESEFLSFFQRFKQRSTPAHKRVADYLREIATGLTYENGTYTAHQTLGLGYGNCLSMAIMTTAIADIAKVRVGYELVDTAPVYELANDLVLKGVHVRPVLYETGTTLEGTTPGVSLAGRSLRIDFFPDGTERTLEKISAEQYAARYYGNLAAEAISAGDYTAAYWMTLESLRLDPLSSEGFNSMAVIYRRIGEPAKAEEIYRYGIANLPRKLTLLRNYRLLLSEQDRHAEAAALDEQVAELADPSPFEWYQAARQAYDEGDYRTAVGLYEKSLDIAPYLHEAHAGLAQAHLALGRTRAAERYWRSALEHTYRESTRSRYEAQLAAVSER